MLPPPGAIPSLSLSVSEDHAPHGLGLSTVISLVRWAKLASPRCCRSAVVAALEGKSTEQEDEGEIYRGLGSA